MPLRLPKDINCVSEERHNCNIHQMSYFDDLTAFTVEARRFEQNRNIGHLQLEIYFLQ